MTKKLIYILLASALAVVVLHFGLTWAAHSIVTVGNLASDGITLSGTVRVQITTPFAQRGNLTLIVFGFNDEGQLRERARADLGVFDIGAAGVETVVPFSIAFDRDGTFVVLADFDSSRVNADGTLTRIAHTHCGTASITIEEPAEPEAPDEPDEPDEIE